MPLVDELLTKEYPNPPFICKPFISRGGIMLLHGKKSLGKSPFSWEMARCVANGLPFLGFPTERGNVLFIEKDTPENLSMPRIKQLPEPRGGWRIEFLNQMSIDLGSSNPQRYLQEIEQRHGPFDLVIWNPLSRFYHGVEKEVVTSVYDRMAQLFPHAGHLLVSHDRKEGRSADSITIDSEEHSGRQEWVNLAQTVFRLVRPGAYLEVRNTGNQVTRVHRPIRFVLTCDNSSIAPYKRVESIIALFEAAPGKTDTEKVEYIAKNKGKSARTIWRALADEKMERLTDMNDAEMSEMAE